MPKAKPYPDRGARDDDDNDNESTSIESPWGDEASTTIEQGELANRAREFNKSSGLTQSGIEEATVDEQRSPVQSAITPIRAEHNARLIITQGNDAGAEVDIVPGKTYTIGRGLDNDVVLTDIAVSRKHFDLKFEDGSWIIVDRGSGNGTVVNGNVEDNPFMLATGDTIEIGNTTFRYDHPNGAPRMSQRTYDVDDDEMSTVAGKPLRTEPIDDPPPPPRMVRPKTLPPPTPLRSAPQPSTPPPLMPLYPPTPASTLPLPQMANRPPLGHSAPTMLGDAMGMPMALAQMQGNHSGGMMLSQVPTTLPGHAPSHPSYPSYPQAADIPPHSVHAQMLHIQTQNRRNDGSTAHVSPSPYDQNMLGMSQQHAAYLATPTNKSKRTKLAIAGIALALLTGIVTAAVVKSNTKKQPATANAKAKPLAKTDAKAIAKTGPTVEPIETPAPVKDTSAADNAAKAKAAVEAADKAKADAAATAKAKAEADKQAKAEADAAARTAKADAAAAKKAEQQAAREEAARKAEQARVARAEQKKAAQNKRPPTRDTTPEPKRVATATDTSGARDKADGLYRDRKFNEAANVLAAAAKNASEDEAAELRDRSSKLRALQSAYAKAVAPAQKANVAFKELQSAINLDNSVGGNFKPELTEKLATVAPKAAVAFSAQKDWGNARNAYMAAKRAGSTDSNLPLVNQKIEGFANELYATASAEASTNPGPAKEKLKQIRTLVDAKSPIATKAQALYNKL